MKAPEYVLLFVLGAIWGLSYVFIRVASPLFGPALLVGLRVAIASGATAAYVAATGQWETALSSFRTKGREYLVIGLVNAALPFTLISASELVLNASYAAILNATTPVFSALATAAWLGQPLTSRVAGGIAVGVLGVAIAVGAAPFTLSPLVLLAVALSLGGSVSYGIGAFYAHRHTADVPPVTASLGQTLAATVLIAPFALVEVPTARWTVPGNVSLLGLALLSTFVAYILYFRILQRSGPTETVTVTFLIPIFGVAWGHLLLGEPIGVGTVVGLAVVLVGIALITGFRPRFRPLPALSASARAAVPRTTDPPTERKA
ncbi:MAG TPA: DMT family transporter [Thermoplasmata archaeon]|nr:DMT family transporter [Thermoplasmata archaeon]